MAKKTTSPGLTTMQKKMKPQKGISLIELMIAFVIVILILSVALTIAKKIIDETKVKNEAKNIETIIHTAYNAFTADGNYQRLTTITNQDYANLFPKEMINTTKDKSQAFHSWRKNVQLKTGTKAALPLPPPNQNHLLSLEYTDIPQRICLQLLQKTLHLTPRIWISNKKRSNPTIIKDDNKKPPKTYTSKEAIKACLSNDDTTKTIWIGWDLY